MECFCSELQRFVVLSKVKKNFECIIWQNKKKELKTRNKMKVSGLLCFSAISRSFLQESLLQHSLFIKKNEIVLKKNSQMKNNQTQTSKQKKFILLPKLF
jgi:hypothetical protein